MTTSEPSPKPATVVRFWRDAGRERWFKKDEAFDAQFRSLFLEAHELAANGALAIWADDAEGALALVILLDQFPRNAFRGTKRMFDTDELALATAARAVARGFDQKVEAALRSFFYLPFEHSEKVSEQERSVELNRPLGGEALEYAELHRDVIVRFGRFPHRNEVLGRTSTEEEEAFLKAGGFAG
ncbi:MAG: DUF924 family protein [Betaproteobacteria bacterium]